MAVNGEIKFRAGKAFQYNLVDNTWYLIDDLKPMWWLKLDDNYTLVNNNVVTNNEYVYSNAGTRFLNMKSFIRSRITLPTCVITSGVQDIACVAHGLTVGEMVTPLATGGGFTANTIYYVILASNPDSFRVSTTYTTANTAVTPTASVPSSTWFKRAGITSNTALVMEGYRGVQFDGTNHLTGDHLRGTLYDNISLNQWSILFMVRTNTSGQPFPAGITPNMYLFEIGAASDNIHIERTSTNSLRLTANGNVVEIPITTAFVGNSSVSKYVFARYDGTTLMLRFQDSFNVVYEESITISGLTFSFPSASTVIALGARDDGLEPLSRLIIDSFRFYDRAISDEELNILWNRGKGNQWSSFQSCLNQHLDYYRWPCEETDYSQSMQQIGYYGRISPEVPSNLNLLRRNVVGVLINQIEDGVKCYKLVEEDKGHLYSAINIGNLSSLDGNTVAFWWKDTSVGVGYRRWIGNSINSPARGVNIYTLGQDASGINNISFTVNNLESIVTIPDWRNVWNFWTIVFDGIKNISSLYKNGVFITSVANARFNPNAGFIFGGYNGTTDNEYSTGFVRDIMWKPYKMNIGEMRLHYNGGKPRRT